MPISRRQFLQRTGWLTAGTLLGPSLLRSPFTSAAVAQPLQDRYFIVVFLDGGNDGINTVVPLADGPAQPFMTAGLRTAYEAARDSLRLSTTDLAPLQIDDDPATGTELALHPALVGFKDLYDRGALAVIQGCGYPRPNLSHEASRRKWMTGEPLLGDAGDGWVGRFLAANYAADDIPAVTLASSIAPELRQSSTGVLGIDRLDRFGFPRDNFAPSDHAAKDAVFAALYGSAAASPQFLAQRLGNIGTTAYEATQVYPALYTNYVAARADFNALYTTTPTTTTKRRLRDIAACILGTENGTIDSRFFQLRLGGFDTHSNQGTTEDVHARKLAEIGDAFKIFYDDMEDLGIAHKVCVLVWSEFSRRIPQNANAGTDHGTQGPMFVIGGSVQGGLYGNHPNINEDALNNQGNTPYSQDPADPFRSIDFRDVYGTILKHWFAIADPSTHFPLDHVSLDPNFHWRSADFDLGFLG